MTDKLDPPPIWWRWRMVERGPHKYGYKRESGPCGEDVYYGTKRQLKDTLAKRYATRWLRTSKFTITMKPLPAKAAQELAPLVAMLAREQGQVS